ncbi:MAG: DUF5665 domain-containing protein [Bacillota bacterium]|nr:DUF5665 domain-containing protein [Bacillota bacterium]
MDEVKTAELRTLSERVQQLAVNMEKMRLAEYVSLLESPWRLLYLNLLTGVARGLGIAVGFTLLGALLLMLLRHLVLLNLPGISEFIAYVVQLVQLKMT